MLRPKSLKLDSPPAVTFEKCPAKTWITPNGVVPGRNVAEHCRIVGEVAREILRRQPQSLVEQLYPSGAHFIAAVHDIGKVSPTFYEKIRRACSPVPHDLPVLKRVEPTIERTWGGHAGVSQICARSLGAPEFVPEILGQHHGYSPSVAGACADADKFGGPKWQLERKRLVEHLRAVLRADWDEPVTAQQARVLAGLTSVADWIGSSGAFENPQLPWEGRISKALDNAGFVSPVYRLGLSFEDIFGFPAREAQATFAEQVQGTGLYILEAPMGIGKTEAALYAAYRVLEKGSGSGIYFALPTQLTSNRIFARFNGFLERILSPQVTHRSLLLHANAWLVMDMGEEGQPGGAWFNQAKRGLLAPFAVGTIDQALMAAMNVKHGFVRAFGLAGKVVILDEIHTYDAYTGTLLDALVELLLALQCTVIILTATLTVERRRELLKTTPGSDAYPLATMQPAGQPVAETELVGPKSHKTAVRLVHNAGKAVDEVLLRAGRGEYVLWIENTVAQAQERYLDLAARVQQEGIECGLLHSRFAPNHRQQLENTWVQRFSKDSHAVRARDPKVGCILVGTQVLEQSLDLDADFMVSMFAPTDLLLQRMGRLWRHAAMPRPVQAKREIWILVPSADDVTQTPLAAFGRTAFVYSPYVLCRSLEVWRTIDAVTLPDDIRPLLNRTYDVRVEEGAMSRWLHELDHGSRWRKGRIALGQLARIGLATGGKTLPESMAQTRYGEQAMVDVLLLRKVFPKVGDGRTTRLIFIDGSEVTLAHQRHAFDRQTWRKVAGLLMQQIVSVPVQDAPPPADADFLRKLGLGHCLYLGDPAEDEALLRVAMVDDIGEISGLGLVGAESEERRLEYRDDLGYRVLKK